MAVQSTRATPALEAELDRALPREAGLLGPPGAADAAVADVERHHELLAQRRGPRRRVGNRRGADNDAVGPGVEKRAGVFERADAARGLEAGGRDHRGDPAHEVGARAAAAGAVEVDQVDPRGACRSELGRERNRVARLVDDTVVVSPVKADGAFAEDVHGGYHLDRGSEPIR